MSRQVRDEDRHAENIAIWEESGHDPGALLLANMDYVRGAAHAHLAKTGRRRLYEEYEQAAALGFLHAFTVKDWDPDKGTVGTFVGWWMIAAMQRDVDRPLGWQGMQATHAMTTGWQAWEDMPHVLSYDQPVRRTEGRTTLKDHIPDRAHERDYDDMIEQLSHEQDVARVREHLNVKQQGWFDDWLACAQVQKPIQELKQVWGVTEPTVANRMGEIKVALRLAFPSAIKGAVKVGRWKEEYGTREEES